jgi:hypothetical protein
MQKLPCTLLLVLEVADSQSFKYRLQINTYFLREQVAVIAFGHIQKVVDC